jgi:enoyl-CoA hydratase/carnithine racemase
MTYMPMSTSPLRLERDGLLAVLTLGHPPLNLMTFDMVDALQSRVDEVRVSDARALLVTAAGELFSAGADVTIFSDLTTDQAATELRRLGAPLETLEIPTVAAVHGLCLTAGFEFALQCDLIWAGASARFGLVEALIGLTPLAGGTQRLAQRAGIARAAELVLSGRIYDAAAMERWGVVNRVLPDDELAPKAHAFAHALAAGPTQAHRASKQVLQAFAQGGVTRADAALPDAAAPLFGSTDLRTGIAALREHGPGHATFSGA